MDDHTLKLLQQQKQRLQEAAMVNWSQAQSATQRTRMVAEQLKSARESAAPAAGASVSAASLQMRQGFGTRLHQVCAEAAKRTDAARKVEERRQMQFRDARRESLVIEKLQERARQRRAEVQRKAEQSMLEDFVASRHGS